MVIPLGAVGPGPGMGGLEQTPTPAEVKDRWAKWFYAVLFLNIAICIGRMIAADIFGALITLIQAYFCWFIVRNDCANMSQHCLFLFGFLCIMNGVLELVTLCTFLNGRTSQKATPVPAAAPGSGAGSTMNYMLTIERHPFFDASAGFKYNWQSAMMIASPLGALIGALVCYATYNTYQTSLFEEPEDGQAGFGGGGPARGFGGGGFNQGYGAQGRGGYGGGYGGGNSYGGTGQGTQGRAFTGSSGRVGLFEGQGHTLGN
mmetsp:Transcript_103490/g.179698  ORF Transcript_103490/g.179698 Transcript_103490/m.179698 type:complete len:260 (+) Transcript_103490:59-838(+)